MSAPEEKQNNEIQTEGQSQEQGEDQQEADESKLGVKERRFEAIDKSVLPPTYVRNSQREQLLLDYANQFETQFLTQFPSHRPLHMSPLNEGGVPKFLPTTLRPALLAKSELIGAPVLAKFVAESVDYEPLHDPTQFSQYQQCPQTTLEFQKGDSLDISLLLVSLLLGAGYNAYVVLGAADRFLSQQLTHKQNAPEIQALSGVAKNLLTDYAAQACFSKHYRSGLFAVPCEFARAYDDFEVVEQKFMRNQMINHPKFYQPTHLDQSGMPDYKRCLYSCKEVQNLYLRPDLDELRLQSSINIQENELLDVHKLLNNVYAYKNLNSFEGIQVLKEQGKETLTGFRHCLTGGGQFYSAKDNIYGASLLCLAPNENAEGTYINKYFKKRPVVPESSFEKLKALRKKMERIGAPPLEVEGVIIEQMRAAGLLEDILVPGETGQQRQQDEVTAQKAAREQEQQHISELSQDVLDGERAYAWVYIAPLESGDGKPPAVDPGEEEINQIIKRLARPNQVRAGCFIDAVSGTVFSCNSELFKRVDCIFNDQNYFVNLQNEIQPGKDDKDAKNDDTPQKVKTEFDIYNIDHWCICVMTQQIASMREKQLKYFNKLEVEESLIKQNGGQYLYIQDYKNQKSTVKQGIDLPQNINKIIDNQLEEQHQKQYNEQIQVNPIDKRYELINKQPITHLQDKYAHRWDYVKPVLMLMSSIPAAWPVQITLDELKIKQNYPLRPRQAHYEPEYVPEKIQLYRDCFIRLFNEYSQQSGVQAIIATRPRPVYRSIFDEEGDCVLNQLVEWRFVRHILFAGRVDNLQLRTVQYSIKHQEVEVPEHEDEYQRLNDGLELISKLDTVEVEYANKKYPLWCFLGEDLDELTERESVLDANVVFDSFSHDFFCSVEDIKYVFGKNRSDQLKSLQIYKDGLRRVQFYECRSDGLGQIVLNNHKQEIIEKFYDYLRQDGLKQRIINYSLTPVISEGELKDSNTDNIKLSITHFNTETRIFEGVVVYIRDLEEQFRDVGSVRQTLNSRRRRFIEARRAIQSAEVKFVAGQKSENETSKQENETQATEGEGKKKGSQVGQLAPVENEDQLCGIDFFAELEYALTVAAFQVYNQQKQLFQTNLASVSNPLYSVQNGSQGILHRHHAKILYAYNLCPDKEMIEYQQLLQQQSQQHNQTTLSNVKDSQMSSTEVENSIISQTDGGDDGTVQAGPQFWRRKAKKLKGEDSQATTSFLKMDIADLTRMKNAQLPRNMHTLGVLGGVGAAQSQASLTENEMKKQQLSLYVNQNQFVDLFFFNLSPQGNNSQKSQEFNQEFCIQQIKARDLPMLTPLFGSAQQAYDFASQYLNKPIRFFKIFYNLSENQKQIRCMKFNDSFEMTRQILLFDQQQSTCHFLKAISADVDNVYIINQQIEMNSLIYQHEEQAIIDQINEQYIQKQLKTQPNKVPQKMPPQNLNNNNQLSKFRQRYQFFQAQTCNYSGDVASVTALQISDYHLHLFAREKSLISGSDNPFIKNNEKLFEIMTNVQNKALTKMEGDQLFIEQSQYGNSTNIFHQNRNSGLLFKPRNLQMARRAQETLGQPIWLKTQPKIVEVKKINNDDFLLPFIPKQYRSLAILPSDVAHQVYEDAMVAMKKRILDRTGYIQTRLAAETANLRKNNKNLEQLNADEKERVMKDIKDSIFRIRIIEMRTLKHIDDGTRRFAQYGEELKKDPRLASMSGDVQNVQLNMTNEVQEHKQAIQDAANIDDVAGDIQDAQNEVPQE